MLPLGVPHAFTAQLWAVWRLLICVSALVTVPLPAAETLREFDVPAGPAAESLLRFGQQARREILFPAEAVRGIETPALRGRLAPREAIDRLMANTGLSVAEDQPTGAFMIYRASRPAPTPDPRRTENPDAGFPGVPPRPMPRKTFLSVLTSLFAVSSASAQTAAPTPAKPPTPPAPGEVIVLETFRVDTTQDRGYVATNSTTGTRLNMAIKDVPMAIEVITREFIDDIGAVDVKESLRYSAGIVQETVQSSNSFTFSPSGSGNANSINRDTPGINLRGFNTRSFLRNGFRQDTVTDVVNIDRQEVARGPQALLYGVAALGGIVNITPKYPRNTPRTTARFGFGSDDFYRAELYNTGPLISDYESGRTLNYGAGFVYQNLSSANDFDDRSRVLFTPALDFRPFRNTNIFLDLEMGRFRTEGTGFKDVADVSAGNVRNEFGLRVAENVNIYNEAINVARTRFNKDTYFRWSGGDTYSQDDYFSGTLEITQKLLDNLTLVVGGNYVDNRNEKLALDSQGIVTTNTASSAVVPTAPGIWTDTGLNPVTPTQTRWKTLNYQWANGDTDKTIKQSRVDLSYDFTVYGNKQSIVLGRQDQTVYQVAQNTAQVSSNVAGGTNRSYQAFNDLSYVRYRNELIRPFQDVLFWEWNTGHYAIYQGRWWDERITTIGGMRWNRYMVRTYNIGYSKADATQPDSNVSNWVRNGAPDANSFNSAPGAVPVVNGYRFGGKVQRDTSPTAGVNVALTDKVSMYATTAGGIFPNTGQRDGAGNPFQAEKTKSREVGLKFDLLRDTRGRPRISGTVAYFEIERENGIYNLFWAPQPRSNNRARTRGFATQPVSGTGPGAYSVTNSGFLDFEASQPVTYLLPIGYVAAGDLNDTRVTGAPQRNGFILVDYASLGSAATDPLRRAMDAAAQDVANFTALSAASAGPNDATGLFANNPYALNRNSDTSYNDESSGVDLQIYFNLTDSLSTVFTYSFLEQGVTGGFRVADQPRSTEYDSWWNYMGVPLADRRSNLDESSYDFSGQTKGARTVDNPKHSFNIWNRYEFREGALRGLDLGLGFQFNGPRQSEVTINNGARSLVGLENVRFKPRFGTDYKLNLGVGYRAKIWSRDVAFRLNVNNLLDDRKSEEYGKSTLFIDPTTGATVASTTAGAQKIEVPERAIRYFDPISFRFTINTTF